MGSSKVLVVLCMVLTYSLVSCLPLTSWQEAPLTVSDIKTVRELGSQGSSIPSTSEGRTCILTPVVTSQRGESRCTWREESQCKTVPTAVKIPVFSPWCVGEGQGVHVSDCKVRTRTEPIVHTVKICSSRGKKECSGPCYNCPTFCKPSKQTWCEKSHEVKTEVRTVRECVEGQEGKTCLKINRRVKKDVVEEVNNCYQKQVEEMCGTINCKFVNVTEECHEKETTMLIQLTQRNCTLCAPSIAEKIELREKCVDKLTDECETDPLNKHWRKLCNQDVENKKDFSLESNNSLKKAQETFRSVDSVREKVFVQDILDKSLAPINDLIFETLRKINVADLDKENPVVFIPNQTKPTPSAKTDLTDLVETLLGEELENERKRAKLGELEEKILEEELEVLKIKNNEPTNINLNIKYEFVTDQSTSTTTTKPKQSVYFDQLLQFVDTQIESDSSGDVESDSLTPTPTETLVGSDILSAAAISDLLNFSTDHKSISEQSITLKRQSTKTTTEIPPTTTVTESTTTTTTTTTSTTTVTTTIETPIATTEKSRIPKKLTAAEYLRLCFTSQTGCDFSYNPENVIDNNLSTTTHKPTTQVTTTTKSSINESLKSRLRLCLFSGLCSEDDIMTAKTSTSRPITTERTTHRPRNTLSKKRNENIRLRTYLCFSEGKCS